MYSLVTTTTTTTTTTAAVLLHLLLHAVPATAASFSGTPAVGSTVNGWKYLGCAVEVPGRVLTGPSYSSTDQMTIDNCMAYCTKNNYPMAGVEYGSQCYCGRFVAASTYDPSAGGCGMACTGNANQKCGGPNRMSVFNATTYQGAMPLPNTAGGWNYAGCYMEPQNGRALDTLIKADDAMTIPMCTAACQGAGYPIAGVEYGRECWCGKTKKTGLQSADSPTCAMQCDMPCGGNTKTVCGGDGALGMYTRGTVKARTAAAGENTTAPVESIEVSPASRTTSAGVKSVRRSSRIERESRRKGFEAEAQDPSSDDADEGLKGFNKGGSIEEPRSLGNGPFKGNYDGTKKAGEQQKKGKGGFGAAGAKNKEGKGKSPGAKNPGIQNGRFLRVVRRRPAAADAAAGAGSAASGELKRGQDGA